MTLPTWIENEPKDCRKTDFIKSFSGADAAVEAEELGERVSAFRCLNLAKGWFGPGSRSQG